MVSAIPISASTWVPISAYYPYDSNIKLDNTYVRWTDGYTAFEHEAFKTNTDYSINKDTIFYLPESKTLFSFLQDTSLSSVYMGSYIVLGIDTGAYFTSSYQYVTVIGTSLYLNALSTDNSFFRFLMNDDGSFSLFQGQGLYVTVTDKTPFNLTLQQELPENEKYKQNFYWHEYQDKIYFSTKTKNPVYPSIGPEYEERFWSYSKTGPQKGKMRANGMLPFSDYLSAGDIYKNDYLFDVTGFILQYNPNGLITDHTWVRYYNEYEDKTHNRDTEINKDRSVSGVYINHLFDLSYNTKININNKAMALNLANLKNIMTSEYGYKFRQFCDCDPLTIGCGLIADPNEPKKCDFAVS